MPPFQSRSTGAGRIAWISSVGVSRSASTPSASRACGRERHRLGRSRPDAAALGDQRAVVVVPRRAGSANSRWRSANEDGRIGVGIDEHVTVVEGRHQPQLRGQEHAVAEHVAGHVADADGGERLGHDVAAELAEVPLDALPGAPGGDPERLVVVAGGSAGREGVAQPEPVLGADLVGGVRQVRRALVGGDHQVGVRILVQHPHTGRVHDVRPDDVVGQVEHAPHQRRVLAALLLHQRRPLDRRPLEHEPALGARPARSPRS